MIKMMRKIIQPEREGKREKAYYNRIAVPDFDRMHQLSGGRQP
jgi:hypothetical protein